jgi:hypothetical protein
VCLNELRDPLLTSPKNNLIDALVGDQNPNRRDLEEYQQDEVRVWVETKSQED